MNDTYSDNKIIQKRFKQGLDGGKQSFLIKYKSFLDKCNSTVVETHYWVNSVQTLCQYQYSKEKKHNMHIVLENETKYTNIFQKYLIQHSSSFSLHSSLAIIQPSSFPLHQSYSIHHSPFFTLNYSVFQMKLFVYIKEPHLVSYAFLILNTS